MKTFEELNLADFIQKAISDLKFETPSSIQAEAIPHLFDGRDIIAMAPTGSGKTLAFAIPAIQKINAKDRSIQALILCPTRELTIQAHKEFEKLSKYDENIRITSIYGGQQIHKQISALSRNPQIIIATPGRLMDHLRQGNLSLSSIKYVVLDEADEMLDMGFREDITSILEQTSEERQTVLFSATMDKDIQKIAERFQKSPCIVDVLDNLQSAPDIEQFYVESAEKDKPELITRLLDLHNVNLSVVFCNTKSNVDKLVEMLKARGFMADAIHGDMNQSQREKVMQGFKRGSIKILVATDVAGRGIDVKNIEAVFNYDLPRDSEDYIHRIGRTGRAGESGIAFSFVSKNQISLLKKIERLNGIKITRKERPSVEELDAARFEAYAAKVKNIIDKDDLTEFKEKINSIIAQGYSELDVAAAIYKMLTKKEQLKINRKMIFEETIFNYEDEQKKKPSRNFDFKKRFGNKNQPKFGGDFNKKSYSRRKSSAKTTHK